MRVGTEPPRIHTHEHLGARTIVDWRWRVPDVDKCRSGSLWDTITAKHGVGDPKKGMAL